MTGCSARCPGGACSWLQRPYRAHFCSAQHYWFQQQTKSRLLCFPWLESFLTGFAAPNIVATISDVSPPEVRSTALAMQSLVETTGAALAPLLTGIVASKISLGTAFLVLIAGASVLWIPCYLIALRSVAGDIEQTRAELRARTES